MKHNSSIYMTNIHTIHTEWKMIHNTEQTTKIIIPAKLCNCVGGRGVMDFESTCFAEFVKTNMNVLLVFSAVSWESQWYILKTVKSGQSQSTKQRSFNCRCFIVMPKFLFGSFFCFSLSLFFKLFELFKSNNSKKKSQHADSLYQPPGASIRFLHINHLAWNFRHRILQSNRHETLPGNQILIIAAVKEWESARWNIPTNYRMHTPQPRANRALVVQLVKQIIQLHTFLEAVRPVMEAFANERTSLNKDRTVTSVTTCNS